MILGAFWMVAANAATLLGAHAILGKIRTGRGALDVVLFLLVRLALVSAAVLAAGVTGTLTATGLGVAGTAALAILLACGAHEKLKQPSFPEVGVASGIFAALVAARLLAQVWFFAPYPGDALGYHLPKVAEWVRAWSFTREMGVDTHVTFPAGFEIVEAWWTVFLHHDALIEMAGVEFLVLGFAGAYALAREVGLGEKGAFLAGLVYAMTPGMHLQATSCVNDGAAAATVVATAALIAGRAPWGTILLAAGLGIGIKPSYGYTLPGMALLGWLVRREPAAGRKWAWGAGALGMAVGAFWYARNAIWFGNPIHPVGVQGLAGPHPIQFGGSLASLQGNLAALLDVRIYDSAGPYGPYLVGISGWGPAALACGLVGLVWAAREDVRVRRVAAGFAVSLVTVFLLVLADPWSMRFALFFPAILSVGAAKLAEAVRGIRFVLAAALGLQFAGTMLPSELGAEVFLALGRQGWRERGLGALLGMTPAGEAIGCFASGRQPTYLLYGPDFSRRVVYLRSSSADELLTAMDREGLQWLYGAPGTMSEHRILAECERRGRLRSVGQRFYRLE